MDTNKAIDQNLLDNILSVNLVRNAMQGKVRNSPENRAKMIKVITDSYGVASTIKHSSDLMEGILYQAANIGILPEVSLFSNSSRTYNERLKIQIFTKFIKITEMFNLFRSLNILRFLIIVVLVAIKKKKRYKKTQYWRFCFHNILCG